MTELLDNPWVQRLGFVFGGFVLGVLLEFVIIRRIHKLAEQTRFKWDDMLIGSIRGVGTIWLVAGGLYLALNVGTLDPLLVNTTRSVLMVIVLGSAVIAVMRVVGGAVEMVSGRAGGTIKSPTLVVNLARIAVGVLGLFIILQNLGIDITALITALGIGGIAIALALQDTLGNLFAGVQIILSRQVRQGNYICLSSGEEGWVTDVKGRNTTIQTFPDGNLVTVPNSLLASSIVKNFSMPRKALWVTLEVGVSYDSDLEHVEVVALEVAKEVLGEVDGGVAGEDPIVRYHTFGDSSINFDMRMMVREFQSQGPVKHEFIKRLHRRFNDEGIEIPFPIRTVMMAGGGESTVEGG
ncbi:MAG: mechanosensitive ion channel family protein [Gemmatimonadota bacterium]|nr:mechanosensitive ion channel family protein [Gemmatimonadota bacterium]MED5564831.1 mechanosensitive ion channel family protein [Gemmatimonadota bacterium]